MSEEQGRWYEIAIGDTSTVFAFQDPQSKDPDGCKIKLIEKVCKQRRLYSQPTVRALIIEMYSIFTKCESATTDDKILDASTTCQVSTAYRSSIMNAAITHSSSEFLTDFALWTLYEKLYFNRGDGSICADLITWSEQSFWFVKENVEKSGELFEPGVAVQSDEFWKGVAISLLCCHFERTIELLSLFTGDSAVQVFVESLSMFDLSYLNDEATTDKIVAWKDALRENLKRGRYGTNENIIYLTKLLIGEEKYLHALPKRVLTDWWHLLPFYVLVKNPLATFAEVVDLAENCFAIFHDDDGDMEKLRQQDTFWCIVSRDEGNFYQQIMQNPWLSVHLVDLIQKSTLDPELEPIRRNLLLNYASSLISHSDLWEIGAGYLISCGIEGLLRLESHIESMYIEDDAMAEKLYEICEENRLLDAKSCVTNTMTFRYLKMGHWSAALGWALKSGTKKTIDITVTRIVSTSTRQELASLNVIKALSDAAVLSLPSLTFLYAYHGFMKVVLSGQVMDCIKHLIPLIMMPDVPTQYYYDLFDYLITILKEDDRTGHEFPKELLYELSTFLATFTLDKQRDLDEKYTKKLKVLKKMVMLKLAESISKGVTIHCY
ncbi:unnamed protein product [Caenorhabditis bovis]|uniref:Nuclear pore complex protein Nup85 n=1 Tax=Caenorhabditis bovis TaxID=2654633 RepID=A0A8S1F5S4_9PELO|nr:unnamed protein product [Caenorhabditis bovis]